MRIITFIYICLFFSAPLISRAQQIAITGEQIRGNVKSTENAILNCEPVFITKSARIISVEGENDGFWINSELGLVQAFSKTDNSFDPKAQGFTILPGKYWVYPNLKQNQQKATVKITIQLL